MLASCHSFFSHATPLTYDQLSAASIFKRKPMPGLGERPAEQPSEGEASYLTDHKNAVSRLAVLLPFLPELQGPEFPEVSEQLMPDLTRYAFTFLIWIQEYAEKTISRQDPKGFLVLYHFYRAVRIWLGGPSGWWAHKRARLLEPMLERRLRGAFDKNLAKIAANLEARMGNDGRW
jgi:hypothetical protein